MIFRYGTIVVSSIRNVFRIAEENQKLRKKVTLLQRSLVRIDRERGYWVAYQQQTAMEAQRAQEIMVAAIEDLRKKLGVAEDGSWVDHLEKWKTVRVDGAKAHPFSGAFDDIGASPLTPIDPGLLDPVGRRRRRDL